MSEPPVLVRREGALGRLTLNRPRSLNAIDHEMVRLLADALDDFEHDDGVRAVAIDGAGERGLSAGGDVRFLVADAAEGGHAGAALLADEYRLDARIARYPKPYVALMDGVVMGGGVGVSAHGSVRVVTSRSVVAMPEVTIGYVPDVGGTWLLGHAPGELGVHAALTAARLGPADAVACGLADLQVEDLPALLTALRDGADAMAAAEELAVDPGESALYAGRDWIDRCYAAPDLPGIREALARDPHPDAVAAAKALDRAAPLAATLTVRAVRDARGLPDLEDALRVEYLLTRCCVRWPDFTEGVRAVLVDRDGAPRWDPATFEAVTGETEHRFLSLAHPDDPPLTFG
ncbi:3-hydroxyisobutyryl-CoA hydrolase [Pseudonocardia dioxanivorans CB1190]|uniref:3-hydroxyisobutyryl-CoA hydrolase n=1 Tax=Pseudonocardia dioxanivorans (strain ATCC 55486 / DSM 44775 / JCM 13855 / CB1190) TaxID=675635 RepID=F4CYK1_PSEUX|nr:enoyl-CoA hydratase/isomerase family protein [Pseudonocardia dioxanivorans]AEA26571.1 3-hydroxyisobutyryl-CoA hydrolase [Pseudonocardia dioxanivorans CB1190]